MKLEKRKWKPVVYKDSGKWYTGYQGDPQEQLLIHEVDEEHSGRLLTLRILRSSRGRSAIKFHFEDEDGFTYTMSAKGMVKFVEAMPLPFQNGWFTADFIQTKQGTDYFIEIL